jgi:integrase/recombinase XerD
MAIHEGRELAPAVQSYLAYCQKARRLSHHTNTAYGYDLAQFQAALSVGPIDVSTVVVALRNIIENPRHGAATVARKVCAIRGFLNWWDGSLADQVFSQVKFKLKLPKRLPKTIPSGELNLLFNGARACASTVTLQNLHLVLVLLASTGLRVSELCSLRLLDVDVENGELKVFGKGAKERVVIIASANVRAALGSYIDEYRAEAPLVSPLFCNKWGGAISPKWVQTRVKNLTETSGARSRITPHMFRHTAAALLMEGGVDIRIIQRLLGHADISTTEIYTYVSDEALRSALERADVMQRFVAAPVVGPSRSNWFRKIRWR